MLSSMTAKQHATAEELAGLEHHEVIRGDIVQKAAPTMAHGFAQARMVGMLSPLWGGGGPRGGGAPMGGWWFATEVELELEAHEVYLPDIAGWRVERVPKLPPGRPIRLRPDWVCEILSPSTAWRDLGHKQEIYHRAHIEHYWLIDPVRQRVTVQRWQEGGYSAVVEVGRSQSDQLHIEPFAELGLDVPSLFMALDSM